ncbi:hydrolase [Burkholderia stabilis]|uniref:CocE/NonD family hydrolase n=1 Tax=Burkholderia stabilis TaxID=95485 RepID=UPI000851C3D0|nr:CocE/NonD family hydrolase [Burkholderia stabilis]AOR70092.1 hydrolase [Burkholderia stabilis]HDR9489254.1 CocE/NonD family hydrolase [Burkholderia stabilis]HDR9522116.1 CocE/NonD family hydrolase [Burkholderia stabilis]HDR9529175.1 CocE/NonD family hydrolase [Burkholderia stabilis]HDR9535412.1 CocE/NonD family hydrolase [Burkholderia stabilis]
MNILRSIAGLGLALAASLSHAAIACRPATPAEAAIYTTTSAFPGVVSPKDGTCWVNNLVVTMPDGTKLTANAALPKIVSADQKFPGIVMIASWATPDFIEYRGQQQRLAQDGYIVLSYTARGFYLSGGQVGVASPQDVQDVSSVVDWVIANTQADADRLAVSGISYGAGMSLLALAHDPRLKTAVAFSGWGDLVDQLYQGDSPNATWSALLFLSGKVTGRLDPIVDQYIKALLDPNTSEAKVNEIRAWTKVRSPSSYIDAINRRGAPVFISKNFQDDMFTPNSSMKMFAALTGPKKLLLNPGVHAQAEVGGALFGVPNYPYDQAHRWFDRWLKGVQNGVDTEPKVSMQVKFTDTRDVFDTWPASNVSTQTLYVGPRGPIRWDSSCLCTKGTAGGLLGAPNRTPGSDLIQNLFDTTATSGPIPVVSTFGESVGAPVVNALSTVNLAAGVRYEGASLRSPMRLRGIPTLNLRVTPSQARAQVVAYLYDVDALGVGTLITHGTRSLHRATPGATIDFPIEFSGTAYDVPAGHHIGIVLDTFDSLYGQPVNPGERFGVKFEFDPARQSTLALPVRL